MSTRWVYHRGETRIARHVGGGPSRVHSWQWRAPTVTGWSGRGEVLRCLYHAVPFGPVSEEEYRTAKGISCAARGPVLGSVVAGRTFDVGTLTYLD